MGVTNSRKCRNYLVNLLYFNLKKSMDPNSFSFIRFESFLHKSAVLLSESCNFYKLKRRELISGENQFCRMSELFGPPSVFEF